VDKGTQDRIDFILDLQAKHEVRLAKLEAQKLQAEARLAATEQRLDKRMDAIGKLIQVGMRMMANNKSEFDRKMSALIDSQMRAEARTDRLEESLKALIDSMRKGSNRGPKRRNGH